MLKFIEKLREKPRHVKKRFAMLFSLSFAGVIFLMWFFVVYPNFIDESERESKALESDLSPMSAISDMFYATFLSFKSDASTFSNSISNTVGREINSIIINSATTSEEYSTTSSPSE
jgi:cytoskeletal protein RodZ